METQINILNFDKDELCAHLVETHGMTKFRGKQLFPWLYKNRVLDFALMSDVSEKDRKVLSEGYRITRPKLEQIQISKDGTRKYLFAMEDGSLIESVLIKQPTRRTLCISSQVGCAIGCKFCRTGLMGLKRNLETSEIIGQVLAVKDEIADKLEEDTGLPMDFTNIVFMGMGEPLHNIDNVIRAVNILTEGTGLAFGGRKITVSTSGMVPAIQKFFDSGANANLAVSLNATTDEVRTKIIPINKKWPINVLLDTLKNCPEERSKRITIEYVMLKGVNDAADDLKRLPKLLHGLKAKVNLIPYNMNTGLGFSSPENDIIAFWQKTLIERGIQCNVRWSKGNDIDAACGQLATKKE